MSGLWSHMVFLCKNICNTFSLNTSSEEKGNKRIIEKKINKVVGTYSFVGIENNMWLSTIVQNDFVLFIQLFYFVP